MTGKRGLGCCRELGKSIGLEIESLTGWAGTDGKGLETVTR